MRKLQKGFTLIELMIAVAIVGILAEHFSESAASAAIVRSHRWRSST